MQNNLSESKIDRAISAQDRAVRRLAKEAGVSIAEAEAAIADRRAAHPLRPAGRPRGRRNQPWSQRLGHAGELDADLPYLGLYSAVRKSLGLKSSNAAFLQIIEVHGDPAMKPAERKAEALALKDALKKWERDGRPVSQRQLDRAKARADERVKKGFKSP